MDTEADLELEGFSAARRSGEVSEFSKILVRATNVSWRSMPDLQPRHSMATLDAETLLRIQEVTEIKTGPYLPLSHPFVEWLIGTIRREDLDRTLFWATADLENKLLDFRTNFSPHRSHTALEKRTPDEDTLMPRPVANLHSYG